MFVLEDGVPPEEIGILQDFSHDIWAKKLGEAHLLCLAGNLYQEQLAFQIYLAVANEGCAGKYVCSFILNIFFVRKYAPSFEPTTNQTAE